MTISSSLNASVAGLAANSSRLASISDNIANSATYGYKRVITDFHSMVIGNSGGTYAAGGVSTTNTRLIDQHGSLVSTSSSTDLAVRGRGMLPVTPGSSVNLGDNDNPLLFTTTGSFRVDADGYLKTSGGEVLMGWPAAADGSIPAYARDTIDGLKPIQISANQYGGEATTKIDLVLNLPATGTQAGADGTSEQVSVEYYDNLGKSEGLNIEFTPTVPASGASNEWTMTITDSASGDAVVGEYTLVFDDSRSQGGKLQSVTATSGGAYDVATGFITVNVDGGPIDINLGIIGESGGLTQLSNSFRPVAIEKNGSPLGTLTAIEVDANGYVNASFDIGISRVLYQIPLADVPNMNGLQSLDHQTYKPTALSGSFYLWDAGDGPVGEIEGGALEESTTDVAGELTDLIKTQRSYSSNAKVIQTVDEMLQETTNIKR